MKTIFDYNPTKKELVELFGLDEASNTAAFGFSVVRAPVSEYQRTVTSGEKLLDLAQLLELRGLDDQAAEIWKQIPDIERQYRGGFDNKSIPS
ncbi:hypothetical protein [Parapedobacter indicus]|uniref:Uncharacterized protein n=1 Tax=Parapedobacter indicus TaxID=1477437 RepID=A0A1I3E293_9SPHI|nr:hypothetical protein [Parapedobacter indicus]PPL04938.1 hypothetical protein CLV26_101748 [Parapedobacter indicus]SFH93094.1 hypothetical protein SAMN05444682_101734 [Parapedobacter indicus]